MSEGKMGVNEWIDSFSAHIAMETHKLLKAKCQKHGEVVQRALIIRYINNMIKLLLIDAVSDHTDEVLSKSDWQEEAVRNYQSAKSRLSVEIGEAFSAVMSKLSNKKEDYYVRIEYIPEPTNKLSH